MNKRNKKLSACLLTAGVLGLCGSASAGFLDSLKKTVDDISKGAKEVVSDVSDGVKDATEEVKEVAKVETGVLYKGYSKEFKGVRDLMYGGNNQQVLALYQNAREAKKLPDKQDNEDAKADITKQKVDTDPVDDKAEEQLPMPVIDFNSDSLSLLNRLEYATLSLDLGRSDISEKIFLEARDILLKPEEQSQTESTLAQGAYLVGEFLSGNEELQPYEPPGYEKVLLLNYQALSYLLAGKEKAYNVTRAAIDLQNAEFEAFKARKAAVDKELAEKQAKNPPQKSDKKEESKGESKGESKEDQQVAQNGEEKAAEEQDSVFKIPELGGLFDPFFKKYDAQAGKVDSAYVNPFASYLSGVVMEFDAYANPSSVDDAHRSYSKALLLNKKSDVIKKAIQDLARVERSQSGKMNNNERLLHLVVADGFVPEKKVVVNIVPIMDKIVTLQHPIIEPIDSQVVSVVIQDHKGKLLAKSSLIADLSAIALRDQKDNATSRHLRSTVAVLRSYAEQTALSGLFPGGQLLGMVRDGYSHPDTRSWASLPSAFYAARLYVPQSLKKITVTTYNKSGKRLATTKVELNPNHNFIYVRSIDKNLEAHKAKTLWVDAAKAKAKAKSKGEAKSV